jgi:hypothetical protein
MPLQMAIDGLIDSWFEESGLKVCDTALLG